MNVKFSCRYNNLFNTCEILTVPTYCSIKNGQVLFVKKE